MVDHTKLITPTSTLDCLYLGMVDFANLKGTVSLYRQGPPLNFVSLARRLCKLQGHCKIATPTLTLVDL